MTRGRLKIPFSLHHLGFIVMMRWSIHGLIGDVTKESQGPEARQTIGTYPNKHILLKLNWKWREFTVHPNGRHVQEATAQHRLRARAAKHGPTCSDHRCRANLPQQRPRSCPDVQPHVHRTIVVFLTLLSLPGRGGKGRRVTLLVGRRSEVWFCSSDSRCSAGINNCSSEVWPEGNRTESVTVGAVAKDHAQDSKYTNGSPSANSTRPHIIV